MFAGWGDTHVGAAAGLARGTGAPDDNVGAQGVAGAVGGVWCFADVLAVLVLDLGTGDSSRGQDGADDGSGLHFLGSDKTSSLRYYSCKLWKRVL